MLDRDQYVLLVEIEYRTYTFIVLFTVVPSGRTERTDGIGSRYVHDTFTIRQVGHGRLREFVSERNSLSDAGCTVTQHNRRNDG